MKRTLIVLAVLAIVVSPIVSFAEEAAPAVPAVPGKHAARELTLKGKITKTTVEEKTTYTLTTADATVVLPALTKEQEILDADVVVVAKGHEVTKDGKKVITVREIVSVKAAAAAPAPVAPEAK